MTKDEQKRNDFLKYLKQLKETWTISPKTTEEAILRIVLSHKDSELDTYIARFKLMINWMTTGIKCKPDNYSKEHPDDGECVDSFVGASITTNNYTSNYSLRLYFSKTRKEIYKFEVLC